MSILNKKKNLASSDKTIILGGGCFWGVEAYFQRLKGVTSTEVGYANGNIKDPTYEQVCSGEASHVEAVLITYNKEITLKKLLEHLFRIIDPFSVNKQGGDIGIQYRTGVYYKDCEDLDIITEFINDFEAKVKRKTAVKVKPLYNYYEAEAYHQKYLDKHVGGYCHVDLNLLRKEEMK